mmetsp:Transcript_43372/g.105100  ORF Transcript_43372/g.105100 Transcript_43372/m.105100 type:complete len:250 (-) Transcript_43372:643-1392(-)
MYVSSVSPDLCDVMTPHPASLAFLTAAILSETEPIWLTFNNKHVQAPSSMARSIFSMFVTVKSSPTIWNCSLFFPVNFDQFDQSSSSKGSSIVTMGKSAAKLWYKFPSSSPLILFPSYLKSRSYWSSPLTLNSDAATSSPMVHFPSYPAFEMASMMSSHPSRLSHGGANPPSSPISVASPPNFDLMILPNVWYTSHPICIASANVLAPVGITKYSWKASLFPACDPPLMTLKQGTGMVYCDKSFPARSA